MGERFEPDDPIKVTTKARLHSGGPYVEAESRVTITLDPDTFRPTHPLARRFVYQSYGSHSYNQGKIFEKRGRVNHRGEVVDQYKVVHQDIPYGRLYIESAVRDDRGKYIATGQSATYIGVNRFVGLRNTQWIYSAGRPSSIEYLVVDAGGNPVSGVPVHLKIEHKKTHSARVKGAGNAYLTRFTHEMIQEKECRVRSAATKGECPFTPKQAGSYKITASIKDTKGRAHSSSIWAWVTGNNHVVWESGTDTNTLIIIPERETYRVGETARYLVQNPFPNSKALVTLERYGVIRQWVQDFKTSTPVVEFEITGDLIPGFYLSVTVVSPRVEKSKGLGRLDLGKPTFRMGYVKVPIKDKYKEIVVSSKTDKEVYEPKDVVSVTLSARERFPEARPKPH